jgi:hypothetical protein
MLHSFAAEIRTSRAGFKTVLDVIEINCPHTTTESSWGANRKKSDRGPSSGRTMCQRRVSVESKCTRRTLLLRPEGRAAVRL